MLSLSLEKRPFCLNFVARWGSFPICSLMCKGIFLYYLYAGDSVERAASRRLAGRHNALLYLCIISIVRIASSDGIDATARIA
jgi:hypothetical protein